MADVEVIQFCIPSGASTLLYIPDVAPGPEQDLPSLYSALSEHFSPHGLLYSLTLKPKDEDPEKFFCFIRYYSARAASSARRANRGQVSLAGVVFKVAPARGRVEPSMPLARWRCEQVANFYLGFNGWSSSMLYHRKEETEQEDLIRFVSVVRLDFPGTGLSCEGAGQVELDVEAEEREARLKKVQEASKRARGEAVMSAWSKVVLVVVGGSKVWVEIDTTKTDPFFYDPLWDHPVIEVKEADYITCDDGEKEDTEWGDEDDFLFSDES